MKKSKMRAILTGIVRDSVYLVDGQISLMYTEPLLRYSQDDRNKIFSQLYPVLDDTPLIVDIFTLTEGLRNGLHEDALL